MKKNIITNKINLLRGLINANKQPLKYICKKYWYFIVIQLIVSIIVGLSAYVSSWMTRAFVDSIVIDANYKHAMFVILFASSYTFLKSILQSAVKTLNSYVFSKSIIFSKSIFINYTKNLNLAFFDIPTNRDCFVRAESYASNGPEQLLEYVFSIFSNIISCISIVYILSPFEIWVVVFLIALMIFKLVIETKLSKKNYVFKKERVKRERKIGYFANLFHSCEYLTEMNIYNSYDLFYSHYKKNFDSHIDIQKKHNIKVESWLAFIHLAIVIQNLVLYGYSGFELFNSHITIGEFTLFFTAIGHLNTILTSFRNSVNSLHPMMLESQNYIEFMNVSGEFCFSQNNQLAKTKIYDINEIEFKNVCFKYPSKETLVLENVSFIINKGDVVSFVGLNGSGKTTIIKLLLGLYRPNSGTIYVNQIPLEDVDLPSYWSLLSTLFQNLYTYAISAAENISMKDISQTDIDLIHKEIDDIGLTSKFQHEPSGVYTELSRAFDPSGTELSGGEKQRILFARTKYKNGELYILDEPSSALDALAEQDLFEFVNSLKEKGKTVIFVSHRLSTCSIANKIIFIENHKIVNIGDHCFMIEHCPQYKKLYEIQAKKFI